MEAPTYFPLARAVSSREAARNAARRPADVVPFRTPGEAVSIDGGGAHEGWRVWVNGKLWGEYATLTIAARIRPLVLELIEQGGLPPGFATAPINSNPAA
jgi:hypothetical protein